MLHWTELARRCKPRCTKCGSTFFEPYSDNAREDEINAGTARAVIGHESARTSLQMRGEREIGGIDLQRQRGSAAPLV